MRNAKKIQRPAKQAKAKSGSAEPVAKTVFHPRREASQAVRLTYIRS